MNIGNPLSMEISLLPWRGACQATLEECNGQAIEEFCCFMSENLSDPFRNATDAIAGLLRKTTQVTGLRFEVCDGQGLIVSTAQLAKRSRCVEGTLADWLVEGGAEYIGLKLRIVSIQPYADLKQVEFLTCHPFIARFCVGR